ncbi:hypothetical protein L6164_029976 [Bauhinia variegata]|uniref:Uncharacterized protein n=1 Tax=Bauhinia variegata TaxID=167791 RepID=A0ACB9LAR7_BAUVA|nr:hypothetical protein L6164_029976 [Bauhinia variegata]
MHVVSSCQQPPLLFAHLSDYRKPKTLISQVEVQSHDIFKKRRRNQFPSSNSCFIVHAKKEDSQQFEVDPDKAKEALQKLDQQLESLSKKQVRSPKIRASDVKITEEEVTKERLEFSDSFLAYSAFFLVLFTIFYNLVFYSVIKPSIDGQ